MRPQLNKAGLKYLKNLQDQASVVQTTCPTCQERPIFSGKITCNVCATLHENEVKCTGRTFSRKTWK